MKVTYTDKQGVTYTLLHATPADVPRFVRAVRAQDGAAVVVHELDVKRTEETERKD
jgi:hypothetical protein